MLDIRLLARFEVLRDGQPLKIDSRPAQKLLAYLALNPNTGHRRDKIAGLLWPESDESNARANLRYALWRLRKAIGNDHLAAEKTSITLVADDHCHIDVSQLEAAAEKASSGEDWVRAVSIYRGELLPGFYEERISLEHERLEAVFQRSMQRLLEALTKEARWEDVIEWGEHWIALGHTPEPAYQALMTAHAGLGDSASMAASYQRCVEALEAELGVESCAESRALYERYAGGERPAGLTPQPATRTPETRPHNLPAQTTVFIGR